MEQEGKTCLFFLQLYLEPPSPISTSLRLVMGTNNLRAQSHHKLDRKEINFLRKKGLTVFSEGKEN